MRGCVVLLLLLAACANERGPHPNLPSIGIQAEFTSRNLCAPGVSPEMRLGGVPPRTATYRWRMTNVSVLSAPSWQADIPAKGSVIAEGAVPDFPAPCLGELERPRPTSFRFEIMALAENGEPLAYGWSFIAARSLPAQIEIEQQRAASRLQAPIRNAPVSTRTPPFFVQ